MKRLWQIVSTTSFLLILTGGTVFVWLWSTDRVDVERMHSILFDKQPPGATSVQEVSVREVPVPGSSSRRLDMQ